MKTKQNSLESILNFKNNWTKYFLLIQSINLALSLLIIPLFRWATSYILKLGDIPYISYTNFIESLVAHPFVFLTLFLLLILLIIIVYFQFTFFIIGLYSIKKEQFSLKNILFTSLSRLKLFKPSSLPFFIGYFLIIIPFSNTVYVTQLLNKVTIPIFIKNYLLENTFYSILFLIASTVIAVIGIKLIFTLPFMVLELCSTKKAVKKSLELTKNHFWYYTIRMILIPLAVFSVFFIVFFLIYLLQAKLDTLKHPYSLIFGIINLSIIQFLALVSTTFISTTLLNILLNKALEQEENINLEIIITKKNKQPRKLPRFIFLFGVIFSIIFYNWFYLSGLLTEMPQTISHRGVNNSNGVQNTISALDKTIKLNPDYIEMDVQETSDNKFVVMHDYNLKKLAGINKYTQELTLEELTNLKARENGQEDNIPSFDDYLNFANSNNQKLLIEIKTSKRDSENMLNNFISKYKKSILDNNHMIHSLDYNVITTIKEIAPEIEISYVLPFNFSFPNTDADAYTMEETTLTDSFILQAHLLDKKVLAWTVNEELAMSKLIFSNVDGIVTDNLDGLNKEISNFKDNPNFSDRILNYIPMLSLIK